MLSIGKLSAGRDAAAYYFDRVADRRCPTDYYTGSGEAPGRWIGRGAERLGLDGPLTTDRSQGLLRDLLVGVGPDGQQLAPPVMRSDPRGRVPTLELAQVVAKAAGDRGLDVEELLTGKGRGELVQAWKRSESELERAQRRPVWPAPSMPAATAQQLLQAVGLDLAALPSTSTTAGAGSVPRRLRERIVRALRHTDDKVDVRLPGLDLTLSAPKSVSVLYALSGAAADKRHAPATANRAAEESSRVGTLVQQAHRTAVQAAIDYLELSCTDALRGHHRGDGTDRTVATDGFVGTAFEHRSSRCGDPQLHTHVVVANLLHGQDGKWSALNTREIYAHAKTAGYVYQAVLRGELTKTLGVEWDPVRNGQADIAGMSKPLLRMFSKRRVQIEEAMDRLGLDGPGGAQIATLNSRPEKGPGGEATVSLQERWQTEARDAGYDVSAATRGVVRRTDPSLTAEAARQLALAAGPAVDEVADALLEQTGLTAKRATFDRKDLLRGVCEHLPVGTPVTLATLRAVATSVLRDARVVPLLGSADASASVKSRRYSTRELLATELAAVQLAVEGLEDHAAKLPTAAVEATVREAEAAGLSTEQQQMLHRLLTSGAGVDVVVGAAGSGKTAALRLACQAWSAAGLEVRGAALAAIAARVLTDSAGIPAVSLQRLLNHLDPTLDQHSDRGFGLPAGGVLIVDEAGMVGTRTLYRLLVATGQAGTKLVLVGDPRQLPEIDAGGLFATLARRLPSSHLEANQRQSAKWEQRALRHLRDGDVTKALRAYDRRGRLRITDTVEDLTDQLLADYEKHLTSHRPEQVLVIASSRRDARRLNALLRHRLLADGRLGNDELHVPLHIQGNRSGGQSDVAAAGSRGFRVGEQVLVTVNDYPRGLLNGCRGTVTTLDHDQRALTVRLDDGRHVHLDRGYLQTGQLTHGYALTAHKAQGTTVDVALLWGTQVLTRETGYVAMSRGRESNTLYSTWDLLRQDAADAAFDLDRPAEHRRGPDVDARRLLARAAVAERLTSSGRQRTARSWWRPSRPSSVEPELGTGIALPEAEPPGLGYVPPAVGD
jgi:conjugative relaxase-like TrwC/TraI family protein